MLKMMGKINNDKGELIDRTAWFTRLNRFKQTTVDRSVYSVNFLQRNLKYQRKIHKDYIWTLQNGLH